VHTLHDAWDVHSRVRAVGPQYGRSRGLSGLCALRR
jgi:hypothetical protein